MKMDTLFHKIKAGDAIAFKELFNQLYPSMCVVAKTYLNDEYIAEDVAQEAFIKLWDTRETYSDIASLKSFLYVMVKNISLNRIKRDKVSKKYEETVEISEQINFSHKIIEEESYRILYQAVETLPDQSKNIIKLSLRGMQNQEIATQLNISVNTVKTLKYNAIKKLRESLSDYYYLILLFMMDF